MKNLYIVLFILSLSSCSVVGSMVGSAASTKSQTVQLEPTKLNSQFRVMIQYPDSIYEEYRFVRYDADSEVMTFKHLLSEQKETISIKQNQKVMARIVTNDGAETGFWIGLGIDVAIVIYALSNIKIKNIGIFQ